MVTVLPTIQFAIATGLILFGIIQLIYQNSGPLNHCMAIALLSLGYAIFYFWAIDTGVISLLPILVNTDIIVTFFSGAGLYLIFTTILAEVENPPVHYKRHFIVPTIFLVVMLVGNTIFLVWTGNALPIEFTSRKQTGNIILHICSLISDIVFFVYIFLAMIKGIRLWIQNEITNKYFFLFMFAFLCCLQITAFLFLIIRFVEEPRLVEYATNFCGILALSFCVVGFRYPEYAHRVLKTFSGQNKRADTLKKQDIDALTTKLLTLMDKKKVFTNPDLNLKELGDLMEMPSQMVSQLIHHTTKQNFKTFINTYRVKAICTELIAHNETPILEIALKYGFNSKSTFNTAFQEITGMTPREYRKSH